LFVCFFEIGYSTVKTNELTRRLTMKLENRRRKITLPLTHNAKIYLYHVWTMN